MLSKTARKKQTYYRLDQKLKNTGVIHYDGFTGTRAFELIIKLGSPRCLLSYFNFAFSGLDWCDDGSSALYTFDCNSQHRKLERGIRMQNLFLDPFSGSERHATRMMRRSGGERWRNGGEKRVGAAHCARCENIRLIEADMLTVLCYHHARSVQYCVKVTALKNTSILYKIPRV